jgi:hypothetical protein
MATNSACRVPCGRQADDEWDTHTYVETLVRVIHASGDDFAVVDENASHGSLVSSQGSLRLRAVSRVHRGEREQYHLNGLAHEVLVDLVGDSFGHLSFLHLTFARAEELGETS